MIHRRTLSIALFLISESLSAQSKEPARTAPAPGAAEAPSNTESADAARDTQPDDSAAQGSDEAAPSSEPGGAPKKAKGANAAGFGSALKERRKAPVATAEPTPPAQGGDSPKEGKAAGAAGFGSALKKDEPEQEQGGEDELVGERENYQSDVDWSASASERPSSGLGLIIAGWAFVAGGAGNLLAIPLCSEPSFNSLQSAEGCRTTHLVFAGVFGALSLPFLIIGYNQRAEYNQWKHRHPGLAQLLNTNIVLRRDAALLTHSFEL